MTGGAEAAPPAPAGAGGVRRSGEGRGPRSVNRQIFSAMLLVGGLSVLVRLGGIAKELVLAREFGTGPVLDAFLVALLLPSFAVSVVAGSLHSSLLPALVRARDVEGEAAARALFRNVTAVALCVFAGAALLLWATAGATLPLLGGGFTPQKLRDTREALVALLPFVVLGGLSILWGGVLNARERFALAALAPLATPLAVVAVVAAYAPGAGAAALGAATSLGALLEVCLLAVGLRRQGYDLLPRWRGLDPATRGVLQQSLPMAAGFVLMSGSSIIDQSMAATLDPGSVAALSYGNRIVAFTIGLGSLALSTAVLPHFARMAAAEDWGGLRHTLRTYLGLIALVSVPAALAVAAFSEPIVRLLFERGQFSAADTRLVAQVQALYVLQVPFYLMANLLVRLISATRRNELLMWGSAINLVTNVGLNLVLMRWLGVSGIALSTTLVYACSLAYLLWAAHRVLRTHPAAARGV